MQKALALKLGHTGKGGRVQQRRQFFLVQSERAVRPDALDEIVLLPAALHLLRGRHRVPPDPLVRRLTVRALVLDAVHQDVLRGQKRQLLPQVFFTDRAMDLQAAGDADIQI